jgi:hypothetical protein
MEIVRHPQTNHVFTAPHGQEDDVSALPVVIHQDQFGVGLFSFWKPSEEELAQLNAGHSIQLGIYSDSHPVVSMGVTKEVLA